MREIGRGRAWSPADSWELWDAVGEPGGWENTQVTTIARRVSELMSEAWYADDAEAAGVNASELVADRQRAMDALAGPSSDVARRHAVVQRFGGVGALLVVACEDAASKTRRTSDSARTDDPVTVGVRVRSAEAHDDETQVSEVAAAQLARLLDSFTDLSPTELDGVLELIEHEDGASPGDEAACARRWLNVTYAVAARDGTTETHHEYVLALDRVLATKRSLLAS